MSRVFEMYGAVNTLVVGWTELGEGKKACAALEWMYDLMDSLHFNPTTMVLIQAQLAGFYGDQGETEAAKAAIRKAAELVKEDSRQEFTAATDFLQIEEAKKMLDAAKRTGKKLTIGYQHRHKAESQYVKACIDRGMQLDIDSAIALENELFGMCFATADQKEGMAAFMEKRTAKFGNQ